MVSQMFQNTKCGSSACYQRELFFSFSAGLFIRCTFISRRLCSEDVFCALLGMFGHQPLPLGFLFFFTWRFRHPYYYSVPPVFFIWESMEHLACDLEPSKAAAFSLELES